MMLRSLLSLNFNTSHVTVYHPARSDLVHIRIISIHLMLLFIRNRSWWIDWRCNFNTSHVTVYLELVYVAITVIFISIHLMLLFIVTCTESAHIMSVFQYISCYCLSRAVYFDIVFYFLFQYISCYCLSHFFWRCDKQFRYFNTSHVTVYHQVACSSRLQ